MAVAPVGADNRIRVGEVFAYPYRIGLLSGVQVGEAGNLPVHDLRVGPLLKLADGFHLAVGPQQNVPV